MSTFEFLPGRRVGKTAALANATPRTVLKSLPYGDVRITREMLAEDQEFTEAMAAAALERSSKRMIREGTVLYRNGAPAGVVSTPLELTCPALADRAARDAVDCMTYALETMTRAVALPAKLYGEPAKPEEEVIAQRPRRINLE